MAQEHLVCTESNFENMIDGTKRLIEESTTTAESSNFFTAKEESSSTSTKNSTGWATLPDPAPSCSEYFSTRIQSIMESTIMESTSEFSFNLESTSEFSFNLESEIEVSKDHWSELQAENGEEGLAESNLEVYRSLQEQWPSGFFMDWDDELYALGEKIAEGAQGEIYKKLFVLPGYAHLNEKFVLKVFKQGFCLEDLQTQWPLGMLRNANSELACYSGSHSPPISANLLSDGRFAFQMIRYWGDLRKVIDLRMLRNRNQAPPFTYETALRIMIVIAFGLRALHRDTIIHRDVKASNVLIAPMDGPVDGYNPTCQDNFLIYLADYECSLGVMGTQFWRAPEILLGVKNRNVHSSLFTEKSDVYSYAMTCYEILTGKLPLESVRSNDYDAVLQGARPVLPSDTNPWIQSLLSRCWHHDPSERPSFEEIGDEFFLFLSEKARD